MKHLLIFLIGLGVSACNMFARTSPVGSLQPEQVPLQSSHDGLPGIAITHTPDPSPTPSPTEQKRSTPPPTQPTINIATIIADPVPDFTSANIYSFAHLANGQLLVTIEVPGAAGDLHDVYELNIENEVLKCVVLEEYPNRLYCHGPTEFAGKVVTLRLVHSLTKNAVFITQAGIPPSPYLSAQNIRPGGRPDDNEENPEPPPTEPPVETPPPYPYP